MKNKLLLTALLFSLIFYTSIFGQNFYAGIIGGLNFADMEIVTKRSEHKVDIRHEYGIGGVFGLNLDRNISIQIEPMYLKKGGVAKLEEFDFGVNMRFSSLEVPILLKVGFGDKIRSYIISGFSFGYILNAESQLSYEFFNLKMDMTDIIKRFEFGLEWGGGISIPVGGNSFFLEARYNFGISNLVKNGTIDYKLGDSEIISLPFDEQDKFKNKGLKILAGFTIPLNW